MLMIHATFMGWCLRDAKDGTRPVINMILVAANAVFICRNIFLYKKLS